MISFLKFELHFFFVVQHEIYIVVVCFSLGSEPEASDNTGSFEMINTVGETEIDQNNIGEHDFILRPRLIVPVSDVNLFFINFGSPSTTIHSQKYYSSGQQLLL